MCKRKGVEKKMLFGRNLERALERYAFRTDLELVRQEMITLETRVIAAELEVAEVYDKAYAALKRLEMRQRREVPPEAPEAVSVDEITDRIMKRRADRAVHAE